MPKKPRVRTLMDSEHAKGSEKLHIYARQYFCYLFPLLKKMSWKSSSLVVSETLRLFIDILTPNDKYSFSVKASV